MNINYIPLPNSMKRFEESIHPKKIVSEGTLRLCITASLTNFNQLEVTGSINDQFPGSFTISV